MIQIIRGGFVFWLLEFGNLQSGICIAAVTSGIISRLYGRVGEPKGGKQWKGSPGFPENVAKMIHITSAQSAVLTRSSWAGATVLQVAELQCSLGPWVTSLPLTVVFSLCRTEGATAQEMSPKRLVRTLCCDTPTCFQRPWQQGCRNRLDPECVIN